jgi:hypothetical protein
MLRQLILTGLLLLVFCAAGADEPAESPKAQADAKEQGDVKAQGDVKMSGMSVLGNEEAPKSLVIVPWKSSQLGDAPGLSRLLDDSTQPVDKEVFMRELAYYQIRSASH